MHTGNKCLQIQQYVQGKHASRGKARAVQGGWGSRGDCGELSSGSAHGRSERESTKESGRVHRGRRCGARHVDVGEVGGLLLAGPPPRRMRPADASVGGVLQRPLSTFALLLQRAVAARLHPAQGTGLLRWQVATVWSVVTRARPRR